MYSINKMPRSTSSSKTHPIPQTSKPKPPAPAVQPKKPTQEHIQTTVRSFDTPQPSFMNNMFQGIGWGAGSSIGRRLFDSKVYPEQSTSVEQPQIPLDSNEIFKKYQECIERNDPDISCEMLLDINSK